MSKVTPSQNAKRKFTTAYICTVKATKKVIHIRRHLGDQERTRAIATNNLVP